MMIDERLDEQLVEQFPAVPLTDERRVKINSHPKFIGHYAQHVA